MDGVFDRALRQCWVADQHMASALDNLEHQSSSCFYYSRAGFERSGYLPVAPGELRAARVVRSHVAALLPRLIMLLISRLKKVSDNSQLC
jgi:hypothetical protein